MKRISRLTALLLALMMLFQTAAFAESGVSIGDMDKSTYDKWVSQALEENGPVIHEGGTLTDAATQLSEKKDAPVYESETVQPLNVLPAGNTNEVGVNLPEKGKVQLTVSGGSGQWQVEVPGGWVSVAGETGTSFDVTFAKVANLFEIGGEAKIRWISADGQTVSETANIALSYSEMTLEADWDTPSTLADSAEEQPSDSDNSGVKKTYNIVINYKFENNVQAADAYTATLAAGSSFDLNVTFPTVQGYLPYVDLKDGQGEKQVSSITKNYTNISVDVTIDVVYKPTNVNYTVIHYQQNVNDDNYTERERETRQGLTNSQVPEVSQTYKGFFSLLYERPNIAADGSTVIEVYYDRYYYLMTFDLDGGYGTEPVYTRYGAEIGEVNAPTRKGYSFGGWAESKGGTAVELPKTMPYMADGQRIYYAIWNPDDTAKVTIVFWGENADDEEYSYLSDCTREINLKPGREFTYSESEMLVCDKEVHTHSDNCLTCDKAKHTHSAVGGSCYTLTCGQSGHQHGISCYPGAGSEASPLNPPDNPKNGQVYKGVVIIISYSYIYINGNWYNYSGDESNGNVVSPTCGQTESTHTHTDSCYTLSCTTEEHTHDEKCYSCGQDVHTHDSGCYMQGAGLDSTKWKFVKSDTITVAADGSSVVNVYYDRVEYSVQYYNRPNRGDPTEYTNLRITAKWGQDIHDKWPTYNDSSRWYVSTSGSTCQNSIQTMPVGGAKFYGPYSGNGHSVASYYVEILPGESYVETKNNVQFKLHHQDTSNISSSNVTNEERYDINGFTVQASWGTQNGSSYNGSKFYYTRNSYTLTFNNQEKDTKTESVKFEAPLNTYASYVPTEVPSWYEPGSVRFDGWYQNPQCTGEKVDLNGKKMPSNDLILYAKWVHVTHEVKFYLTEESTEVYQPAGDNVQKAEFSVPHGTQLDKTYVGDHLTAEAMNEAKPNGNYKFVVWYYYEDGVKTYFDPTVQIRKDMTLYGEWSSDTLIKYTVKYVTADGTPVADEEQKYIDIADDTTGSGLAGKTKTFEAKGGDELYEKYREGYYPTTQSQSVVLDINAPNGEVTVTFVYVPAQAVPYTVNYVTAEKPDNWDDTIGTVTIDGTTYYKLAASYTNEKNCKAVVTEQFKVVSGYMPDTYQKRLVVTVKEDGTANTEKNVLNFIYTKDNEHAYYKIVHYTQNTDAETWTEYASSEAVGGIGKAYTADPMTISGFTYKEWKAVVVENGTETQQNTGTTNQARGTLTANGLELRLYYVRNSYPYQVRYLEQGTGNQLHDPKNGTGLYGQMVSESAIDINGYDKVDPTTAAISIKIETDNAAKLNIITFYYTEQTVTINYQVVGPEGCGTLSSYTETVKVKTGTAVGSTPTANNGFKFVGWYKNENCNVPVEGDGWLVGDTITPQKVDDKNVAATYYAKFEWDVGALKITKNGLADDEKAIFKVTVTKDGTTTTYNVTLGNGSVTIADLPANASYTVEEEKWSWSYTASPSGTQSGTIQGGQTTKISFANVKNEKWLYDEHSVVNMFDGNSNQGGEQ